MLYSTPWESMSSELGYGSLLVTLYGRRYTKRSLMSWVVVIPKEGWMGQEFHYFPQISQYVSTLFPNTESYNIPKVSHILWWCVFCRLYSLIWEKFILIPSLQQCFIQPQSSLKDGTPALIQYRKSLIGKIWHSPPEMLNILNQGIYPNPGFGL